MRVLAALSGGVDSAAAAALLLDAGHEVTGVFLRNGATAGPRAASGRQGCCSAGDAADAARVAEILGIPFYSLDFSREFGRIVEDFAHAYAAGRTPNPCVACNRDLKFGALAGFADSIGASAIATGHYAAREDACGRVALRVPADAAKDQTYVLFPLSQEQLRRTLFPLAALTKPEVRRLAAERGLPVAEKPESMELCFVPDGDYRGVVASRRPDAARAGDVVDERTGAVVGRHAGVATVTVGQRRGLGVAGARPVYVTSIDASANRVLVGGPERLERRVVLVDGWNPVSVPAPEPGTVLRGRAKVRRNHTAAPAAARACGDGRVSVEFDDPVRAPAPGQALVLYDDGGRLLGGGWIAGAPR